MQILPVFHVSQPVGCLLRNDVKDVLVIGLYHVPSVQFHADDRIYLIVLVDRGLAGLGAGKGVRLSLIHI